MILLKDWWTVCKGMKIKLFVACRKQMCIHCTQKREQCDITNNDNSEMKVHASLFEPYVFSYLHLGAKL